MPKSLGYVVYDGPSKIDGAPIVALASTGKSQNRKTGDMVQVWILNQNIKPSKAVATGHDEAICGRCAFRPVMARIARDKGEEVASCYVSTTNGGPNSVWHSYRSGRYESFPWYDKKFAFDRPVRIGAYGDPAAVPLQVWDKFLQRCAKGWTAYTHQWKRFPSFSRFCMASVNDADEQQWAIDKGYRTFRVIQKNGDTPLLARPMWRDLREIACPAAEHKGYALGERSTCAKCLLCDGKRWRDVRANIAVDAH